ncbi:hypothetical protein EAI_04102, partial [Harpegnathos saltator]
RVRIGWTRVGVTVLPARAEFCFKCLEQGHVRGRCGNTVDRSDACYRCGDPGHRAKECKAAAAHCPVCAGLGRRADHKVGDPSCRSLIGKEKR